MQVYNRRFDAHNKLRRPADVREMKKSDENNIHRDKTSCLGRAHAAGEVSEK